MAREKEPTTKNKRNPSKQSQHPCDEACYPWADDEPAEVDDFPDSDSGVWSSDD